METTGRREFLERLAASAALSAGYAATASGYAANETINVGAIGVGGRMAQLLTNLSRLPGVRLGAISDIWDHRLAVAKTLVDPKALVTRSYREVLDQKDIDAVIIATPDHWHARMTIDACGAGKDVYVEKPLTHSIEEGAAILAAQKQSGRVVQVGTQQRSMPHFQEGKKILASGQLGKIHKVMMTWNRNQKRGLDTVTPPNPTSFDWKAFLGSASERPFNHYVYRNWRWFWDFGGGMFTDLMVHWSDVMHWFMEVDHPASAVAVGANYQTKDLWETPDTAQCLLDYPEKEFQAHFEGTFVTARRRASIEFRGRDATLYLDRGRYEILSEREDQTPIRKILTEGELGQDFYREPNGEALHLANWLECVRSRKEPHAPVAAGVSAANPAHLANIALRGRTFARWPS